MIHLEKIGAWTYWDIRDLEVQESQEEFVAANNDSVAQAYLALVSGEATPSPSMTTRPRSDF